MVAGGNPYGEEIDDEETQNSELLGSSDSQSLDDGKPEKVSPTNSVISTMAADSTEDDTMGDYTCEMCSATFHSLNQFMNHRNFECLGEHSDDLVCDMDLSEPSGSATPSSSCSLDHGGQSPSGMSESPASPGVENISPDQLPFSIGISETNPYGCPHCDKAFPRHSYLKLHEQEHGELMPFRCSYCSRLFRHKRSRDRHVKLHTGDKKYKCSQCDAAFARSDHLKSHLRTHDTGKPFKCTICNRGYTTAAALSSHMYSHRKPNSSGQMEYKCYQCEEIFYQPKDLQNHYNDCHAPAPLREKTLQCTQCSEMFVSQELLDLHVEQEHVKEQKRKFSTPDNISDIDIFHKKLKTHNDISINKQMLSNTSDLTVKENGLDLMPEIMDSSSVSDPANRENALVCPYCLQDNFESLELLEIHMQCVHSVKATEVYTCNYCNAPYPNLYALHDHMKVVHQNLTCMDIKYPCSLCSRHFTSIDALAEHKKHTHSQASSSNHSLYCAECALLFQNPMEFQEHIQRSHNCLQDTPRPKPPKSKKVSNDTKKDIKRMNSHSIFNNTKNSSPAPNERMVEEKMVCDQCNATFLDIKNFQTHLKIHLDSVLTQYICPQCQKQFTTEDQLESHLSLHYLCLSTEYGCTSCMKTFSKPDELQKHLMDIHAHHLYRCSLCKEIFDSKVNIQVHFAIKHSNECKIYKCTKCNSVFISEVDWQLHVRSAHLQMPKPHKCLFCKEGFTTEVELQCHLTIHGKPFKCPMCSEAFHVEYLLDKHLQNEHDPDKNSKRLGNSQSDIKVEKDIGSSSLLNSCGTIDVSNSVTSGSGIWKSTDPLHTCNICDMKFSNLSSLQLHKKQDHRVALANNHTSQVMTTVESSVITSKVIGSSNDKVALSCTYCSQSFKSRTELERHMKIHLNSSSQKCNICDEVFPSPNTLAEHKLQHCKIPQGNICVGCKIPLKSEDQFYIHSQEHGFQGAIMQCVICRQTLASMMELQMHGKHHFQTKPNFFTCCVCLRGFDSKENLISKLNSSGRTYFVCKPCYHGETSDFHCNECGARFPTNEQLESHVTKHRRTYQCIKCQQSFSTEYEIQLHVATHVLQEGNIHECKLCSQVFDSPAKLQCHLIEHTYGNSEYRCSVCCKVFSNATDIQAHAFEHGIHARKFGCIHCNQRFFFSAELDNHMINHVKPESVSELQCKDCPQTFSNIVSFNAHRRIHQQQMDNSTSTPIKCTFCHEVFNDTSELQKHFFTCHTEQDIEHSINKRNYQCSQCNKECSSLANLQNHMKIHKIEKENQKSQVPKTQIVDVKPVLCPVCGQIFSKRSLMKEHMNTVHLVHQESKASTQGNTASTSTTGTEYGDVNGDSQSCASDEANEMNHSSPQQTANSTSPVSVSLVNMKMEICVPENQLHPSSEDDEIFNDVSHNSQMITDCKMDSSEN
ncbi:finger 423-like [Octopus vulgaris]|uniref:Finger 423-like n=3 Tax=Octopus TaxID=6643 RepID=A0AA36AFC1_OCTVU|nr:finger 423-like [Octopus vulgaris]